jgi:CDP-paratose 2-epimerase
MKILVTGSNGLIGREVVTYFAAADHIVHGIDNNMRADFFGLAGDTPWNQGRLTVRFSNFQHHEANIPDRG